LDLQGAGVERSKNEAAKIEDEADQHPCPQEEDKNPFSKRFA
jgi:hypothetical protein